MAIPDFQSLMLPFLKAIQDGKEHTNKKIVELLAKEFNLTEEEIQKVNETGPKTFENRVMWTKSHLKNAGFIEYTKRGSLIITELGKQIAEDKNIIKINLKFLKQYIHNEIKEAQFTWMPVYNAIAEKLLEFKLHRRPLIDLMIKIKKEVPAAIEPIDKKGNAKIEMIDIDPFTFFANFNRGLTDNNRKKIIHVIQEHFNLPPLEVKDFMGIPVVMMTQAWFVGYIDDREEGDIELLWEIFEKTLKNNVYNELFDKCINIKYSKLLIGLYWINPKEFIALDKVNQTFFEEVLGINKKIFKGFQINKLKYDGYHELKKEIDKVNMPYWEISYEAWKYIKDKPDHKVNYYKIAPGENASLWEECLKKSEIRISWKDVPDLNTLDDIELESLLKEKYPKSVKKYKKQLLQFKNLSEGDIIIANNGVTSIKGFGKVIDKYTYNNYYLEFKHVVPVKWFDVDERIFDQEIKADENWRFYTIMPISLVDYNKFINIPPKHVIDNPQPYTKSDALAELFISEAEYDTLIALLKHKKNLILQGPPGVGKTFFAKKIAHSIIGQKDDSYVEMIQFHQSYSYEDFIQGFRPDSNGNFRIKDGVFYEFCKKAMINPDKEYFFIIDEINRGNLSKIFGELMMLIEKDKRGQEILLTYRENEKDKFTIPQNLYLIGTMNTADRSLAMVDYALRRRFAFVDLKPAFHRDNFRDFLLNKNLEGSFVKNLIKAVEEINTEIAADKTNLGDGYKIGHSYFCTDGIIEDHKKWLDIIIDYEIAPLLNEYWFDNSTKAEELIKKLRIME